MADDRCSVSDEGQFKSLKCVEGGLANDGSDGWVQEPFDDFDCECHDRLSSDFGMVT